MKDGKHHRTSKPGDKYHTRPPLPAGRIVIDTPEKDPDVIVKCRVCGEDMVPVYDETGAYVGRNCPNNHGPMR